METWTALTSIIARTAFALLLTPRLLEPPALNKMPAFGDTAVSPELALLHLLPPWLAILPLVILVPQLLEVLAFAQEPTTCATLPQHQTVPLNTQLPSLASLPLTAPNTPDKTAL